MSTAREKEREVKGQGRGERNDNLNSQYPRNLIELMCDILESIMRFLGFWDEGASEGEETEVKDKEGRKKARAMNQRPRIPQIHKATV